jgi:UDP-N-acetylmuramyl pentapeptide phosphotransferase/UDP-N-acetylglucosamine-1-phosphate transferase
MFDSTENEKEKGEKTGKQRILGGLIVLIPALVMLLFTNLVDWGLHDSTGMLMVVFVSVVGLYGVVDIIRGLANL